MFSDDHGKYSECLNFDRFTVPLELLLDIYDVLTRNCLNCWTIVNVFCLRSSIAWNPKLRQKRYPITILTLNTEYGILSPWEVRSKDYLWVFFFLFISFMLISAENFDDYFYLEEIYLWIASHVKSFETNDRHLNACGSKMFYVTMTNDLVIGSDLRSICMISLNIYD